MLGVQDIINFIDGWRTANNIPANQALTEGQYTQFQSELNTKVGQMSYAPPSSNSTMILYSGGVLPDGAHSGQVANSIAANSNGAYYTIESTTAGQLFKNSGFNNALLNLTNGDELTVGRILKGGTNPDLTRSPYSFSNQLSLGDYVSREFVLRNASGNVMTLTGNSTPDSVFAQSEFKLLMENQRVTSINGVTKSELQTIINAFGGSDDGFAAAREQVNLRAHLNSAYVDGYVVYKKDAAGNFELDEHGRKIVQSWTAIDDTKINGGTFTAPAAGTFDEKINIGKQNGYLSVDDLKTKYSAWGSHYNTLLAKDPVAAKMSATTLQLVDRAFSHSPTNPATYFEQKHPKITNFSNKIFDPKTLRMSGGSVKALGALGAVFLVADVANAYNQYQTLKQNGQDAEADKFMYNYTWRTATAFTSAYALTQLAMPVMLGLAALGPVGVLAGFGVLFGAGIAGWTAGSFAGDSISNMIWSLMEQAGSIPTRIDPLVLDLNGDGITTTSVADGGIYYDLDNNGFAEKTGWINASDGILALDRDGNGLIEAGKELFGDRTILDDGTTASSGFAALATLDSNNDGVIDANDEKFADLRVWIDANQDGVSSPQELFTLAQVGVKSINLTHTWDGQVDANGNTIARVGSFTRTDDTTSTINEYFLARDPSATVMTDWVDIPEELMDLPDINSMGNVYSLRQAMARDDSGTLQDLVEDFISDTNPDSRAAKIDAILFAWTGSSDIDPTSRGSQFDARKLAVLERTTGTSYRNSPVSSPTAAEVPILNMAYATFAERVYDMLSYQSHLRSVFSGIGYEFDYENMSINIDPAQVIAYIDAELTANATTGEEVLAEVTRILRTTDFMSPEHFQVIRDHYYDLSPRYQEIIDTTPLTAFIGTGDNDSLGGVVDRDNVLSGKAGDDYLQGNNRNDIIYGGEGNDSISAGAGDDEAYGGAGDDTLYGGEGNDTLLGHEGVDTLYGNNGNDTLDGGAGNDHLEGALGDDTYVFGRGYGVDTIIDRDASETDLDTIRFLEDVTPADVFVQRVGDNLELSIIGTSDKIIVDRYFSRYYYSGYSNYDVGEDGNKVEQIVFADGTIWDIADIKEKARTTLGTTGDDSISGFSDQDDIIYAYEGNDSISTGDGNDVVNAGDGNDTVYTGTGDDTISAGAGDDTVTAGSGNDTLDGGAGTDRLIGDTGNDTYVFGRGYGADTIVDRDATEGNVDIVEFASDITPTDLTVVRSGDDLLITVNGTTDSLRVERYFSRYYYSGYSNYDVGEDGNKVEEFHFTDGTVWTIADMKEKARVITGTAESDGISGYGDQENIIYGLDGDDSLYGAGLADALSGGAGNDTLTGQGGNDTLDGGVGNDILVGAAGNDTYVFGLGYGADIIRDHDSTEGNIDKITMLEGIAPVDVTVVRSGDNLILKINGTEDSLTVERYFTRWYYSGYSSYDMGEDGNKVEEIVFSDGTTWTIADVKEKARDIVGTADSDSLSGYDDQDDRVVAFDGNDSISTGAGDDVIDAGAGDDTVYAGVGNDSLVGGAGNDTLYANDGNDTLNGGTGDDRLEGALGNDTYIFGRGYGVDTIADRDASIGNQDVIQFASDISPSDIIVRRSGDNLELQISGTDDKLIIDRYFSRYYYSGYSNYDVGEDGNKVELIQFADGTAWTIADVKEKARNIIGTSNADSISGYSDQQNIISGLDGDDYLYGSSLDDTLYGGNGNDQLNGSSGNDTLDGGAGEDKLAGGLGNDTYVFGRGYGADTIEDHDATENNIDTVTMLEGVAPSDVTVVRSGDNLILKINGTEDSLLVKQYFSRYYYSGYSNYDVGADGNKVERITFNDGTIWTIADVKEKARDIVGTAESDSLSGYDDQDDRVVAHAGNDSISTGAGNDVIDAGAGDDTIYAGTGDDALTAGDGNDTLYGNAGNDTLDGGTGNDRLEGGLGNDIYVFGTGYGVDTISDPDSTAENQDVVQFTAGVAPSDILVKRSGDNLELQISGTDDKLVIERYFTRWYYSGYSSYDMGEDGNKVELLKFADGTTWTIADIKEKARNLVGSSESDSISGFSDQENIISGLGGDDSLYGSSQADQLFGGEGNDTLYGYTGNDSLDGGAGNDRLEGSTGNDTYIFGTGYGVDTIYDSDSTVGNIDAISFSEDISPAEVKVIRNGNNLELVIGDSSDKLIVEYYFSSYNKNGNNVGENGNKIEEIRFADGTIWDIATIKDKARTITGTASSDSLSGYSDQQNIISGLDGDDTLYAGSQGDQLIGGAGNDALRGSSGADTLTGGTGNDSSEGASGNDTYIFASGDGVDTIYDTDSTANNFDTITFQSGIDPSNVVVKRIGDNLELSITGTDDKLTVERYFSQYNRYGNNVGENGNAIEEIRFSDGTVWDITTVKEKARHINGDEASESISGFTTNDIISGFGGDDVISAGSGNDTLDGGTGNDTLYGESGDDTYVFSVGYGADTIMDSSGLDKVTFGEGITPDDITITRTSGSSYNQNNLIIGIKNTTDQLTINGYFYNGIDSTTYKVEQFVFTDGTTWTVDDIKEQLRTYTGTAGNDSNTNFGDQDLTAYGLAGDDYLYGSSYIDQLFGGEGNDYLYAGSGNDTLDGGTGDDMLYGESGNDTYVFGKGYGVDTIQDHAGSDKILFAADIAPEDVDILRTSGGSWNQNNLTFLIKGTTDSLTIQGYFYNGIDNPTYKVEQFVFADGTTWTHDTIKERLRTYTGTPGSDTNTNYGDQDLTAYGLEGDDYLYGSSYVDKLYGGEGNDYLSAGSGSDTLDGGTGDDILYGESGNDTYIFGRGYGVDTIQDHAGSDTVTFLEGVDPADVAVTRTSGGSWNQNNLVLKINGTNDALTVQGYFYNGIDNPTYKIEQFVFANGTTWTHDTIKEKLRTYTGTAGNDVNTNYGDQDLTAYGLAGDDTLYGSSYVDKLYGGDGNDYLYGGSGSDTLDGGNGDDALYGESGNDTYVFGRGYGVDAIQDHAGSDIVAFASDIAPSDITISRTSGGSWNQNNLVLKINGTNDTLTIQGYFYNGIDSTTYKVEQFTFADGTVWTHDTIKEKLRTYTGTENNDTNTNYGDQNLTAYGLGGDDTLYGSSYVDVLYGGEGNDYLYGGSGADTLDGGTGNDMLYGESGNDTYVFGLGYGTDSIQDHAGTDVISFLEGINPADVTVTRTSGGSWNQNNLVLGIQGTTDSLTIQGYFYNGIDSTTYKVEEFRFADGTTWTHDTIKEKLRIYTGTAGNDTNTNYGDQDLTAYGLDGDDSLYGSSFVDKLYGGDGTDYLAAGSGNDTLDGGAGNDTLYGESGNDTYVFSGSFGNDQISDHNGDDLVQFNDANKDNLIFERVGNALRISSGGSLDDVSISSWYSNSNYQIETVKASDGSTISNSQVEQLIQAMASWSSNNGGMSWSQALSSNPQDVQAVVSQYWTAPTV